MSNCHIVENHMSRLIYLRFTFEKQHNDILGLLVHLHSLKSDQSLRDAIDSGSLQCTDYFPNRLSSFQ